MKKRFLTVPAIAIMTLGIFDEFDTATGATLVDISEYFEVAARAFNNVK